MQLPLAAPIAAVAVMALAEGPQEPQGQQRPLRKFVVADIETRVPVRNVVVWTKDGYKDTTNYRGICYIPQTFDTLFVTKANYLTEKIVKEEVKDSTYIIPNSHRISEVTVWGKDGGKALNEGMGDAFKRAIEEGTAEAPKGVAAFDMAKMLDKRGRRDRKHLKKVRKQFKKMDKFSDDPIEDAYLKDQDDKRLAREKDTLVIEAAQRKAAVVKKDSTAMNKSNARITP